MKKRTSLLTVFSAFEECYTFMLRQTDNWQEQVATIQVLEVENGKILFDKSKSSFM
jgi:hypothetical protein